MTGPDDFSDGESTPLTQDYAGRYDGFIVLLIISSRWNPKFKNERF